MNSFLLRKLMHLVSGAAIMGMITYAARHYDLVSLRYIAGIVILINLVVEWIRLDMSFCFFPKMIFKRKEKKNLFSFTHALLIGFVVFTIFPLDIAFASLAVSIFGDVAGALVGRYMAGQQTKSWQGALGFLVIGTLTAMIYVPLGRALVMALVGALVEWKCKDMEDNLIVPLVAGFAGYLS